MLTWPQITSIWPVELSQKLPSTASIDAIDLSLAQCPPTQWLPKNITLIAQDVFEPFPESMRGKYDIVHIQLFVCIVKENDPSTVVRNLMDLLSKPGSSSLPYSHNGGVIFLVSGMGPNQVNRARRLSSMERRGYRRSEYRTRPRNATGDTVH